MKQSFAVLLGIMLAAATACAQSPDVMFQQANQLYQEGKMADAANMYENILRSGLVSGEVYYNLGNAYYKGGSIPKAILCYERALRYIPGDDDLRHNLQLANLMIADRIEPTPKLFVWEYWDTLKSYVSLRTATWLVYSGYALLVLSWMAFILGRRYGVRKTALYAGGTSVVLLALFITMFVAKFSDTRRSDEAIVQAPIVTVKNSPDPKSSDAFVLHGGVKVQIVDSVGAWAKIRLADGKVGWMEESAAEII